MFCIAKDGPIRLIISTSLRFEDTSAPVIKFGGCSPRAVRTAESSKVPDGQYPGEISSDHELTSVVRGYQKACCCRDIVAFVHGRCLERDVGRDHVGRS